MTIEERDDLLKTIEVGLSTLSKSNNRDFSSIKVLLRSLEYDVRQFWDIYPNGFEMTGITLEPYSKYPHLVLLVDLLLKSLNENSTTETMKFKSYLEKYLDTVRNHYLLSPSDIIKSSQEIKKLQEELGNQKGDLSALGKELREGIGVYKNNIKSIESEEVIRKNKYEELNKEIEAQKKELLELMNQNKELSISLENNKKEFGERAEYLDSLMGKEVGKSLFLTFDKRKKELSRPVIFWAFLVIATALGLTIFIYCLFKGLDFSTIGWTVYLANTIRLLPVVIVLFFCIRQYQRERNFQEEYAFKSAVALTIDAYSKQIEDKDKRDDMIIESVSSVYDSPIAKHQSKENIKNKSMLEGINAVKGVVVETAKDVAGIAKDIK